MEAAEQFVCTLCSRNERNKKKRGQSSKRSQASGNNAEDADSAQLSKQNTRVQEIRSEGTQAKVKSIFNIPRSFETRKRLTYHDEWASRTKAR